MKYFTDLCKLKVFSFSDAVKIIGSKNNTKAILNNYIKKKLVCKIKRDLYTVIDVYNGGIYENPFLIASHITDSSFVSLHSAFEYYGCYNQMYNLIQVSSISKFNNFVFRSGEYEFHQTKTCLQVVKEDNIKVSTLERTIVDSIDKLGKCMDVEELCKCLDLIKYIDINLIKEMLDYYDTGVLYKKVGYILWEFKDKFNINNSFFEYCKRRASTSTSSKISNCEVRILEYVPEWNIYGFKNLKKIYYKGDY